MKKEIDNVKFAELATQHKKYLDWHRSHGNSDEYLEIYDNKLRMENACLQKMTIRGAELDYAGFHDTDFNSTIFEQCSANNARITGCVSLSDELKQCTVINSRISSTNIYSLNIKYGSFKDTGLSASMLRTCLFEYVDMRSTGFIDSHLNNVSFYDCNFADAVFQGCYMNATFVRCNLSGVKFYDSAVQFMGLVDCENVPQELINQTRIVPDGEFIAYKSLRDNLIATLLIPADAKRSNATGRKCRASKAKVIKIETPDGKERTYGESWHDPSFIYRTGDMVYPNKFNDDRWNVCSHGIHFYMTREECLND